MISKLRYVKKYNMHKYDPWSFKNSVKTLTDLYLIDIFFTMTNVPSQRYVFQQIKSCQKILLNCVWFGENCTEVVILNSTDTSNVNGILLQPLAYS